MPIVKMIVDVDVPEGATHYFGNLLNGVDDLRWVKRTERDGVETWWEWRAPKSGSSGNDGKIGWYVSSYHRPHWVHDITPASLSDLER